MTIWLRIPETPATKAAVALVCSYEVAAIATGLVPTITALSKRWPIIGAAVVAALAVHFATPTEDHHGRL